MAAVRAHGLHLCHRGRGDRPARHHARARALRTLQLSRLPGGPQGARCVRLPARLRRDDLIGFQALVNIAAVTVTLPTTGIPLPFISYGGSSLAITLLAVGILMNVSTQSEKVGWIRHASIDLGRRHGRTFVPGDRRRAGAVAERT